MTDEIFEDVIGGLNQALAHARGEHVPGMVVHVFTEEDVAAIRKRAGTSKTERCESEAMTGHPNKRGKPEG